MAAAIAASKEVNTRHLLNLLVFCFFGGEGDLFSSLGDPTLRFGERSPVLPLWKGPVELSIFSATFTIRV
jgi:hypothetical protein